MEIGKVVAEIKRTWERPQFIIKFVALCVVLVLGSSALLYSYFTSQGAGKAAADEETARNLGSALGRSGEEPSSATDGSRFSVACSPGRFPAGEGNTGRNTCTVKSFKGFSEPIDLSCERLPPAVSCDFAPTSVTPPPDGYTSFTLNVWWDRAPPGDYVFDVVGRSGAQTSAYRFPFRRSDAGFSLYDFSCATDPSGAHVRVLPGQQGEVSCSVSSQGGFSSPVALRCTSLTAIECRITKNPVTPPRSGSAGTKLIVRLPKKIGPGFHELLVETSPANSSPDFGPTARILVNVPRTAPPSFNLNCEPRTVSVVQGSKGLIECRLDAVNGFDGDVRLNLAHQTAFVPYDLSPVTLRLTGDGSTAVSRLTVDTTTLAPGTYGLSIAATSADNSANIRVLITVTAPPPSPTPPPPPPPPSPTPTPPVPAEPDSAGA